MFYIQTLENRRMESKAEVKKLHDENTDCENCSSTNSIILDEERGEYICKNCGLVYVERCSIEYSIPINREKSERNTISVRKRCPSIPNQKYQRLINSHLNKQPQDIKSLIKRYIDVFSPIMNVKQSMINDVEHFLMKVPPQYFHIKNTDWNGGFRFYEVLLTIFYYLHSKKIGFRQFKETLRGSGVMLSLRRMREIKYKLEQEKIFKQNVFNLVSMEKFEKESDITVKKLIIEQTTTTIKSKFYTDLDIGLKRYFEQIDFKCLKRVKKQELKTCKTIDEYRQKLFNQVNDQILKIPYIELVRFQPKSIYASITYYMLRKHFKKDYIAELYDVTEATISNLQIKLKEYI